MPLYPLLCCLSCLSTKHILQQESGSCLSFLASIDRDEMFAISPIPGTWSTNRTYLHNNKTLKDGEEDPKAFCCNLSRKRACYSYSCSPSRSLCVRCVHKSLESISSACYSSQTPVLWAKHSLSDPAPSLLVAGTTEHFALPCALEETPAQGWQMRQKQNPMRGGGGGGASWEESGF